MKKPHTKEGGHTEASATAAANGLSVRHVSKSFGDKKAVDDLSFAMTEPGVFGLIGTNGAGKTTTIRMILGVTDRDEGEITWNGGPLNRRTVRFGYMPEERGIYPKIKVFDQLVYFGRLRGMSRRAAADAVLSRFAVSKLVRRLIWLRTSFSIFTCINSMAAAGAPQ